MKAIFMIYDQELQNEVDFILRSNRVEHFSRFDGIKGQGESGLKLGDAVGPGLNCAYWIVLPDEQSKTLVKELKEFKNHKLKNKGIQLFVLPVEEMI